MPEVVCPRCFRSVGTDPPPRYCRHCGLSDVVAAANDTSPVEVTAFGHSYRVGARITVGSLCTVYHCTFDRDQADRRGIFKIARDARANTAVANEAATLRELASQDTDRKFIPFLPAVVESAVTRSTAADPARQWNVLDYHPAIKSPDDLYTLAEVRQAYPAGLDARDVAWIWRRLLHVLSFVHRSRLVHGAVLPPHVLIEPSDHKLVLIDWCFAGDAAATAVTATDSAGFADWFSRFGVRRQRTVATDIATAARCMVYLLGSDNGQAELLPAVDPAVRRHFTRCMSLGTANLQSAGQLLGEFDRLIEALWGPRQFRPLTMPAKPRA